MRNDWENTSSSAGSHLPPTVVLRLKAPPVSLQDVGARRAPADWGRPFAAHAALQAGQYLLQPAGPHEPVRHLGGRPLLTQLRAEVREGTTVIWRVVVGMCTCGLTYQFERSRVFTPDNPHEWGSGVWCCGFLLGVKTNHLVPNLAWGLPPPPFSQNFISAPDQQPTILPK